MRSRLQEMRTLLVAALAETAPGHDFSHIERTTGMFCYLGISPEQVARIKKERGVYMVDSSRINVCGITAGNVVHNFILPIGNFCFCYSGFNSRLAHWDDQTASLADVGSLQIVSLL